MKKILLIFSFLLFVFATASYANVSQETQAGFVVQNTDASTSANVTVEFYNSDGSSHDIINRTIAPLSTLLIDPDDVDELTAGWSGSATITSDNPVVGVGWTETFSKYGKPEGMGWYNLPGQDTRTQIYVPMIRHEPATGFESKLWIQNTGDVNATIVVSYYSYGGGGNYISSCSVMVAKASLESISSCSFNLPDSFVGSAVVSSDQPVVVVASQSNQARKNECAFTGIPGVAGDEELFFPIVLNNFFGWNSSFAVQNMGSESAQGNFDYHKDNCNTCGWESTISTPLIDPNFLDMFTPVTSPFAGYGIFSATQPFGSVASSWNDQARAGYCYNGFWGGTTFLVPVESTWYLPRVNSDSRILVKNTNGGAGGTIKVSWLGISEQQTILLSADDKQVITPAVPGGWSGSAVIEATESLPLAILVQNEQASGTDLGMYKAYSDNEGTTDLYVPHVRKAQQFLSSIWKIYNPAIVNGSKEEK